MIKKSKDENNKRIKKMKVERFLSVMDETSCFEIEGQLFLKKELTEDIKRRTLEKVLIKNNRAVLILEAIENKAKTLEDLNYSFDVGV